jgi:hypothetical protein
MRFTPQQAYAIVSHIRDGREFIHKEPRTQKIEREREREHKHIGFAPLLFIATY